MAPDDTDRETPKWTTRRNYIRAAGVAGAGFIAGCSQGDAGDEPAATETEDEPAATETEEEGVEVLDRTFNGYIIHHRPNRQSLNPWASTSIRPISVFHKTPLVAPNQATARYETVGLQRWSVGNNKLSGKIHPDLQWHNGDDVTVDDLITNHKLRWDTKTISRLNDFVGRESIEKTGDKTFDIGYEGRNFSPEIVKFPAYSDLGVLNTSVYGPFLERFEDATSDSERETITSDLAEEEITWADADAHGNGIFRHSDTGREFVELERWDDHYLSNRINWSTMRWKWTPQGQMLPNLQNEEYTTTVAKDITSMEDADAVPDSYIRNRQLDSGGWCLVFQHDDEIFGDKRVRQALAHISDTETVAQNAGAFRNAPAPERFTGMVPQIEEEFVGDILDSYTTYDDPEHATELLREAGFTRDGGEWFTPSGDRFEAQIKVPTSPEVFSNTGRSFASQAQEFGIQLEVVALEVSNYWSDFPGGDFRAAIGFWGSGKTTNPWRAIGRTIRGNSVPSQGANIDLESVEAPPVGEPGGEMQTYNLREAFNKAARGENFDEQIRTISWAYNHMVPVVPGTQRYRGSFHMDEGWSWPDLDSDLWQVVMAASETSQGTGSWPVWSGNVAAE